MVCGCLRKKLDEFPELIFPLAILIVSIILLFIGIAINAIISHYHNLGDALIIVGGVFSFFTGVCLCSVWDGKYRDRKKSIRVWPINKVGVNIVKYQIQPHNSIQINIENIS